jgi:periplasmic divalent cation tolerance protein
MNDNNDILVVYTTCDSDEQARSLAEILVSQKLVACVNILPQIQSVYIWNDEIQQDEEWLLVMKTHRRRYTELEQTLLACHPYEVPEIIALPVVAGSKDYLDWLTNTVE